MSNAPRRCPHCQGPQEADALFCEWCGAALQPPSPPRGRGRRGLVLALVLGGLAIVCVVVAAGGALFWWRGQREGTTAGQHATQASAPAARRESVTPRPTLSEAAPLAAAALDSLAGEWVLLEEGGDQPAGEPFRLLVEPNGWVRVVLVSELAGAAEQADRLYMELSPAGSARWEGFFVTTAWQAGEERETHREPMALELTADLQQFTMTDEDGDTAVARRLR